LGNITDKGGYLFYNSLSLTYRWQANLAEISNWLLIQAML